MNGRRSNQSGGGDKTDVRNGMNLGADDYLVKPPPRLTLLEAIEARFERQRLNDERVRDELSKVTFRTDFSSPEPLVKNLNLTDREAETLLWVAQANPTQTSQLSSQTAKKP
jgi:DNA-binding response OmpR family regulator